MSAPDVWIGIDAGKASHHAVAIDADGKKLWAAKVGNGQQQIEELINRAATTAAKTGGQVDAGVEQQPADGAGEGGVRRRAGGASAGGRLGAGRELGALSRRTTAGSSPS
ncbi:IS110 family transposase [Microbispora sp. NPDC004025]